MKAYTNAAIEFDQIEETLRWSDFDMWPLMYGRTKPLHQEKGPS